MLAVPPHARLGSPRSKEFRIVNCSPSSTRFRVREESPIRIRPPASVKFPLKHAPASIRSTAGVREGSSVRDLSSVDFPAQVFPLASVKFPMQTDTSSPQSTASGFPLQNDASSLRSTVSSYPVQNDASSLRSSASVGDLPSARIVRSESMQILPAREPSPIRKTGPPSRNTIGNTVCVSGMRTVPLPTEDRPWNGYVSKFKVNGNLFGSLQKPAQAGGASKFSWLPLEMEMPQISVALEQFLQGSSCNILELFTTSRYATTGVMLGTGKHSQVIQVESKIDGTKCAAKVLSLSISDERKIRREAAAMVKIQHKNSAQLVDVLQCREQLPGVMGRPPYVLLVMKQIDGEPLSSDIVRKGPNPALAFNLLSQISDVLATMHRQMCVHRDIWSENILVDKSCNMHLIDFGCFEMCDCPSDNMTPDALNIPYLPPSAASKFSLPAASDDMWSLGLVLTEVVTGKPVMFRMGRSDVPFYLRKDHLQTALDETTSLGGAFLGRIATKLLTTNENERLCADEVLALCRSQTGTPRALLPAPILSGTVTPTPRHSKAAPPGSVRVGPSRGGTPPSVVPKPITNATQLSWTDMKQVKELAPGQSVMYEASTHKGSYPATVVGRSTYADAWLIELQIGGVKAVNDTENWRITPI